ncbi:uncharacterized protein LOC120260361 isoform X2 [Dioscorea cayenensis subsp. rotundata]|uniref:Uncharacterized protein LOC120260361 isoform X2 n=2 Tax=Dioscorea cayennensis subsp. rotundata TaxID=55577 RepID=A0AB40B8Z3_DIOCR|nr:uncharacterized protein LOC120260361 isoform X2 [Dioscorea cayenensis subsp. rotundata]XP_039123752.1 uncharacterized protein LOC120260361 isoform X2 [Dioscorea cayenensis subsp. rotundata]XP_039123753.1 uncharacterized protein LOC120260361 isoform X2 [Dioscorea cayenensis subsp. rotundata]
MVHCRGGMEVVVRTFATGLGLGLVAWMGESWICNYNFLEGSPNILIPTHGRLSMWPKRMLCGYLKRFTINATNNTLTDAQCYSLCNDCKVRELSILKAIESGAYTLSNIIAKAYPGSDPKLWIPASLNIYKAPCQSSCTPREVTKGLNCCCLNEILVRRHIEWYKQRSLFISSIRVFSTTTIMHLGNLT